MEDKFALYSPAVALAAACPSVSLDLECDDDMASNTATAALKEILERLVRLEVKVDHVEQAVHELGGDLDKVRDRAHDQSKRLQQVASASESQVVTLSGGAAPLERRKVAIALVGTGTGGTALGVLLERLLSLLGLGVFACFVGLGCDDASADERERVADDEIGELDTGELDTGTDTGDPVAETWPGWCCETIGDAIDYECCSLVPSKGGCAPGEVLVYSRDHPSDSLDDGVCE